MKPIFQKINLAFREAPHGIVTSLVFTGSLMVLLWFGTEAVFGKDPIAETPPVAYQPQVQNFQNISVTKAQRQLRQALRRCMEASDAAVESMQDNWFATWSLFELYKAGP